MSKAYASRVVDSDVATVWSLVRDFAAVERWIPGCRACEVVSSDPSAPVRRLTLGDGSVIDEVLVTRDDDRRRIQYAFTSALPRGMRSFLGTAHCREITDGSRTFIEWMSEFDCDADREARLVTNISATLATIVAAVGAEAEGGATP